MPLRLILARHAKSAWDTDAPDDHSRPLNKRGARDAPRVAARLAALGWVPTRVLSSDSARTRQTWELMQAALPSPPPDVIFTRDLYHAEWEDARAVLSRYLDAQTTTAMLLGHNPGLEDIAFTLTGQSLTLTTANCALLTSTAATWAEALNPRCFEVEGVIRPKELP